MCDLTSIPPTTVTTNAPASTVAPTTAASGTDTTIVVTPTVAPDVSTTLAANTTPTRRLPATGSGDAVLPITAAALVTTGLLAVGISRRQATWER